MKNTWSKLLAAMLLSTCMVLALLPFSALADEVQLTPAAEENPDGETLSPTQEEAGTDALGLDSAVFETETPADELFELEALADELAPPIQGGGDDEAGDNIILEPGKEIPGKDFVIPPGVAAVTVPNFAALEQIELTVSSGALGGVICEGTVSLPYGSEVLLPDGTVFQSTQFKFAIYNYDVFAAWIDGHLCISGNGRMWNSITGNPSAFPWYNDSEELTSVTVMDGITNIGDYAFSGCKNLKSVYVPSTVSEIGESAFAGCSRLILCVDGGTDAVSGLLGNVSDATWYIASLNGYAVNDCETGHLPVPVKNNFAGAWYDPDGNVLARGSDGCYLIPDDAESGSVYTAGEVKADVKVPRTITFVVDGKALKTETLYQGDAVTAPDAEPREGYTFHWDNLPETMPDEDITVTGRYTVKHYTVTFDTNPFFGAVNGEKIVTIEAGCFIKNLPAAVGKTGYTFIGWKTSDGAPFTEETPVVGDMTVTARWQVTFTFSDNGKDIFDAFALHGEVGQTLSVDADILAQITAEGEAKGWRFLGWATGSSSYDTVRYESGKPINVVNAKTANLYAKWDLLPTLPVFSDGRHIRVEFRDENDTLLSAVGFTSAMNESDAYFTLSEVSENDGTNPGAPAKDYPYQCTLTLNTEAMISGWAEVTGVRVLTGEAQPQITLYCRGSDGRWATWTDGVGSYSYVVNYVIALKLPDCTVTVNGTNYTVEYGASLSELLGTITPPASGNTGFEFAGWTYSDGTEIPADAIVTGETLIVSAWKPIHYTVIIDGEEYDAPYGYTLSLLLPKTEPVPPKGMEFDAWVDDGGSEITKDTVVTGPMVVTARWRQIIYTLTYVIDGVTARTQEYAMNDAIEVMAAPSRSGYTFNGWTGLPENNVMPAADVTVTGSYSVISLPPVPSAPVSPVLPIIPVTPPEQPEAPDEKIEEPETPLAPLPFLDVAAGSWYADPIVFVLQKDLMRGTSETTFAPALELSRSMMAQLLYNLDGKPDLSGGPVFTDVSDGAWYSSVVNWAAANGFVNGRGDGTFGPEDGITREQMILVLYNYARLRGMDVTANASSLLEFRDSSKISDWAREAMAWGVTCGLTCGCGDSTLAPQSTASRAEAAALVMRFCNIFLKDASLDGQGGVA